MAQANDPQVAVDRAVTLVSGDAEAHAARGEILQLLEDYPASQDEFARAAALRPRDYFLWLRLGMVRDQNHDSEAALRALRQSVALAPSYAQPRWQLGNLLLRMRQMDEAFIELVRAANSNPTLWPNVIDLAWGTYGQDVETIIRVLRPETDTSRMALALFFAHHKQGAAALAQFRQARPPGATNPEPDKKTQDLLDELLRARAFAEAYEIWAGLHGLPLTSAGEVKNGGFEGPVSVGQNGFGWQIAPAVNNVAMSVDEGEHHQGGRSLRLDFKGDSNPTSSLIAQIILVKPGTRYQLSVAALTQDFLSGADPVIMLIDASDPKGSLLAQSPPLRSEPKADPKVWREFAIEFTTNADTRSVSIVVARQTCATNPCPAFGTVWLDSVVLTTQ
jgi:tetratricopeptide (TPR) repeat protein